MARAWFRFYAELNDFLPPEIRLVSVPYDFDVSGSVKDAIESFGVPHTEVDLVLVNGESVDFARLIRDGDRVSVYPVFEALDISAVLRVRPEPLREPRFVCDVHLGRLAGYLRMLGFDAVYRNDFSDAELARTSREQRRILLTRDLGLLKRGEITHGYFLRATEPRAQLAEVLRRFDLLRAIDPFTRCMRCNAPLEPVAKEQILHRLEHETSRNFEEFKQCLGCGRVYWKGPHYRRMREWISRF